MSEKENSGVEEGGGEVEGGGEEEGSGEEEGGGAASFGGQANLEAELELGKEWGHAASSPCWTCVLSCVLILKQLLKCLDFVNLS